MKSLKENKFSKIIDDASKYILDVDKLKPLQYRIIRDMFNGFDVSAVLPTGYGKSACYILSGAIFSDKTLVISPLIQLINEQTEIINKALGNNKAVSLSEIKSKDAEYLIERAKFIYTTPEKLINSEDLVIEHTIRLIVIDEAHCISLWSEDFRIAYDMISNVITKLKERYGSNILSLTATANKSILSDIYGSLPFDSKMKSYNISCFRNNISLHTIEIHRYSDKMKHLNYLLSRLEKPGIVYCMTKQNVEIISNFLESLGYNTQKYHSGLGRIKKQVLKRYRTEDNLITVCTNAMGLGINKRNLRFVIHFDIPQSPEIYIQESGRCGRDGLSASSIILYNHEDRKILEYLIDKNRPSIRKYEKVYHSVNPLEGRTSRKISFIANVDTGECYKILERLKDYEMVKKIEGKYYRYKEFKYESLSKFDRRRYINYEKLDSMIEYCELNNTQNKWEWLLEYMGYEYSSKDFKMSEEFSNDWIDEVIDLSHYEKHAYSFLKSYHPKIRSGKSHSGGYAFAYYSVNNIKTNIGKEIHKIKYELDKKTIDRGIIKSCAEFIKNNYNKKEYLICVCPSSTIHDFMKNFAWELSTFLIKFGIKTEYSDVIELLGNISPQKNMKTKSRKINNTKKQYYIEEKYYLKLKGKAVLLIDDIYDSGYTTESCSSALKDMGVKDIEIFTLTKTHNNNGD